MLRDQDSQVSSLANETELSNSEPDLIADSFVHNVVDEGGGRKAGTEPFGNVFAQGGTEAPVPSRGGVRWVLP